MTEQTPHSLDPQDRRTLLTVARESIAHGLRHGQPLRVNAAGYSPALREQRATFVTLEIHHQLRGCIGVLQALRPLVEDVSANAFAAAMRDPRFPPLSPGEFDQLDVHISVLSPAMAMRFTDEEDLVRQLRPGIDGLILAEGKLRGTFLPSVWESLPDSRLFLAHLKRKAGLLEQYWSRTIQVWRYTTESIP